MDHYAYYHELQKHIAANLSIWQATIVSTEGSSPSKAGMKAAIGLPEIYFGNLGGGEMEFSIIQFIRKEKPSKPLSLTFALNGSLIDSEKDEIQATNMICGGSARVFIEPLYRAETLYIIGAGHCGRALAHLARLTGFYTCLIDNRDSLLSAARSDSLADDYILSDYSNIEDLISNPPRSWLVIMTHGHLHDREVLQQCLKLNCRYLGMIGSQNKVKETFSQLLASGVSSDLLKSVYAPIGLPIGSQSPEEIAVSIMAQIISIRSGKSSYPIVI